MIYKTLTPVGSKILRVDTIYYQEKLWLIPEWLVSDNQQTPKFGVLMTGHKYQDLQHSDFDADFLLNDPLPESVFGGTPSELWLVDKEIPLQFDNQFLSH